MISLRLNPEMEEKLKEISEKQQTSKSEIVKDALEAYFAEYEKKNSPFELGSEFFGKYGSGRNDLSQNYKQNLREKLNAKHSH